MMIEVSKSVVRLIDVLRRRGPIEVSELASEMGIGFGAACVVQRTAEAAGISWRKRGKNLGGRAGCEPTIVGLWETLPQFRVREQNRRVVKTKAELFEQHVIRQDGCWSWRGHVSNGYAYMRPGGRKGRLVGAHRVSYEIHKGAVPDGMLVCHHCDNPICTNPEHLFIGTNLDNTHDRIAKGRPAGMAVPGARKLVGEENPWTKLSDDDVLQIRSRRAAGERCVDLAKAFAVSPRHISVVSRAVARRSVCA